MNMFSKRLMVLVLLTGPCLLMAQNESHLKSETKQDIGSFTRKDSIDRYYKNFMASIYSPDINYVYNDFLECCIFTKTTWDFDGKNFILQTGGYDLPRYNRNSRFQGRKITAINWSACMLYRLAYWQEIHPDADEYPTPKRYAVEIKDTAKARLFAKEVDKSLYFGYLRITKTVKSERELSKIMQCDLDSFFGVRSKVEKRRMRCYALVKIDTSASTKGGIPKIETNVSGVLRLTNQPIAQLVLALRRKYESGNFGDKAFINEAGWNGNIDIQLSLKFDDINQVKAELRKYGFDIVEKDADVPVIIVSDALEGAAR